MRPASAALWGWLTSCQRGQLVQHEVCALGPCVLLAGLAEHACTSGAACQVQLGCALCISRSCAS